MHILRTADFTALPWKNGLGVSSVIASHPKEAGYDKVDWQVGTTDIGSDCPFSSLAGMDRQFTLLSGPGVELTCIDILMGVNTRQAVDIPFRPFAFRGDAVTTCRLLGAPVKVFNVMTRRSHASASLRMPQWTGALLCEQRAGEVVLAVVLAGRAAVGGTGAPLAPFEAVQLDAPAGERCELVSHAGPARAAVVRLSGARSSGAR